MSETRVAQRTWPLGLEEVLPKHLVLVVGKIQLQQKIWFFSRLSLKRKFRVWIHNINLST